MSQERACPKHFKGRSFFHFSASFFLRYLAFANVCNVAACSARSTVFNSVHQCSVMFCFSRAFANATSHNLHFPLNLLLFQIVSKVSAIASIGSKPSATGCRCCGGRSGRKLRNTFSANDFDFDFPRAYVRQRPLRGSCAAVRNEAIL